MAETVVFAEVIGPAIVTAGSSLFVQVATLALTPKPKRPGLPEPNDPGFTQLIRISDEPQRIIYGERLVSGVLVFAATTGEDNAFLHLVVALAGHEVEEIGEVLLDGEPASGPRFSGELTAEDWTPGLHNQLLPLGTFRRHNGRLYEKVGNAPGASDQFWFLAPSVPTNPPVWALAGDFVRIIKHTGADDQAADDKLVAEVSEWTAAHRLRGIAYVYLRLRFNRDIFSGIPNVTARVRGRKVVDPRAPANPAAWTNNAALCLHDYLTLDFGLDADPAGEIDVDAVKSAADICDEDVDLPSSLPAFAFTVDPDSDICTQVVADGDRPAPLHLGDGVELSSNGTLPGGLALATRYYVCNPDSATTFQLAADLDGARKGVAIDLADGGSGAHSLKRVSQPRYTTNGVFTLGDRPIDIVPDLYQAMAGALVYTQGRYVMFAGAYTGPAAVTFGEGDLRDEIRVRPRPGRRELHNAVRGIFTDRDNAWQPTDFPPVTNPAYEAADGAERIFKDVELAHVTDSQRAQRIARLINERDRQGMTIDFPAKLTALEAAVMDTVELDIAQLGLGGATVLSAPAAAAVTTIDVDDDVRIASLARLDPGGPDEEAFTVTAVTGTGPYTLSLSGALAATHPAGAEVAIRKEFEVLSWTLTETGGVDLTLKETAAAVYAFDPETDATVVDLAPNTTLPDPFRVAAPTGLALASGDAELLIAGDGTAFSRLRVSWTPPNDVFVTSGGGFQIQFKKSADANWTAHPGVDGEISESFISPVEDGVAYDVRLRSVNQVGVAGPWALVAGHVVAGKSAAPADVVSFTIDGATLEWTHPMTEPDLDGFVIRYHQGVNRSWGNAIALHSGVVKSSPYTLERIPSGQVTFLIKTVDTSGNFSATPTVIVTELGDAPVANAVESVDFKALGWPGTLANGSIDGAGDLVADDTGDLVWDADASRDMWTLGSAAFWTGSFEKMTYTDSFAPSKAAAGSKLTLSFTAVGDSILVEYRRNGPDPMWSAASAELMWDADGNAPLWTIPPFQSWPGEAVAVNDRYDLRVTAGFGVPRGKVSKFTPTVDVPDVVERFNDVALPAAGLRLALSKTFTTTIVNVSLTLQDDGGNAATAKVIDKNLSQGGPLVRAFDAAGAGTAARIDATVQGY